MLYIDSSALLKRYRREKGTEFILKLVKDAEERKQKEDKDYLIFK